MGKTDPNRNAPHEVDDYIAAQEPKFQATLTQLRAAVAAVAPQCSERVSYGIPVFRLKADFVGLSAAKHHCALHTMSKAVPAAMGDALRAAGIGTSGTTLHLQPGIELPASLVETVLRRRLAELGTG